MVGKKTIMYSILAFVVLVVLVSFTQIAGKLNISFVPEKEISKATKCALILCRYGCFDERLANLESSWNYNGMEMSCLDYCTTNEKMEKLCTKENPIYITMNEDLRITPNDFRKVPNDDCFDFVLSVNGPENKGGGSGCGVILGPNIECEFDEKKTGYYTNNPSGIESCMLEEGETYKIITTVSLNTQLVFIRKVEKGEE